MSEREQKIAAARDALCFAATAMARGDSLVASHVLFGNLCRASAALTDAEKPDRPRLMSPVARMRDGFANQSSSLIFGGAGELTAQMIAADRADILAKARELPIFIIGDMMAPGGKAAIYLDDLAALLEGK